MKWPFVKRITYDNLVDKYQADKGIIAYVPTGQKEVEPWHYGGTGENPHCYHDRRIGWVRARHFADYSAYMDYLKSLKEDK